MKLNQRVAGLNIRGQKFLMLMVSASLAATIVAAGTGTAGAISSTGQAPVKTTHKSAHFTTTSPLYTTGQFYGGGDSPAVCYTCEAADVTGSAPLSESLDTGSGVNTLTGDYSTTLKLFQAASVAEFGLSLTYDAELAQAELTSSPGATFPFGVGWSSNYDSSVTPQGGDEPTASVTVNSASGSQETFNQSSDGGESGLCPTGDYPTTDKYTIQTFAGYSSEQQWCGLASVKGQLWDIASEGFEYQTDNGQELYEYAWNGSFSEDEPTTQFASGYYGEYTYVTYDVPPGGTFDSPSYPCPTTVYECTDVALQLPDGAPGATTLSYIQECFNDEGQITEIIDPSGVTYTLSYDGHDNLTSVTEYANQTYPSTWHYVYDTGQASPRSSDLIEIYDPDSGVGSSPSYDAGVAHSNSITYNNSGTYSGMASSVMDGTGAETTYGYADACDTGQCVATNAAQQTTVTYPAQVPSPGGTAVSPVEVDSYVGGVESSTSLGSSTNSYDKETWSYNWSFGYGASNSTETITYPNSIAGGTAPTATIVLDPAGNIISTTNALGDVATSAYNDSGDNDFNELLWSYPGSSTNGPSDPPTGSWVYTYNSYGQVGTATDPLGNVTTYGYYEDGSLLCYVSHPSVTIAHRDRTVCNTSFWDETIGDDESNTVPIGATVYNYDEYGDLAATTVNDQYGSGNTTSAYYNEMGDQLWTIAPAGQFDGQGDTNPYAAVTTYTPSNQPATVDSPSSGLTTNTYDAAGNLVSVQTPSSATTTYYDGDNRACYQVVASSEQSLTSCPTPASGTGDTSVLAGSTVTTYVPGSTTVASSTDGKGYTTWDYYADLAYPLSPTEAVDSLDSEVQYSAYNDFGNACVTGDVSLASHQGTSSQCNTVSGDTKTVYNAIGDETSITDPSGNATTNTFTNTAYPTVETSTENALSKTTSYAYDADGDLISTTNPDASVVSTSYDGDGQVCVTSDNGVAYACGSGTGVSGVTAFAYDGANEEVSATTYSPSAATTSYSYSEGQLTSTTDSNGETVSYLYNDGGQIQCVAYPVSSGSSCGSVGYPATASPTNTIESRSYDTSGRLSSISDWMTTNNETSYTYGNANFPDAVTKITYPSSTSLTATYGYDSDGNLTSLTAGSSISDAWTYNHDEQVATTDINGSTSATVGYNANSQITAAANLATSTSNDTYTVAANGETTKDAPPSGTTYSYAYNAGDELCTTTTGSTATSCGTNPSTGTTYAYSSNGERSSATPFTSGTAGSATYYDWNALGELCNVAAASTSCGTQPTSGTSYQYNGNGLRITATTSTTTTDSAWDVLSGGSVPLNINDAATTSGATTNTSYLYGNLLFGGTAPLEQITTTSSTATPVFLVPTPTGVQGVYSTSGGVDELAVYSLYGKQTISSGSHVTPFGFQGSYTDSTGLIHLINRYYDPTTYQFLSIDPAVATTDQPYVYTNDNPLNATDPLGLKPKKTVKKIVVCVLFGCQNVGVQVGTIWQPGNARGAAPTEQTGTYGEGIPKKNNGPAPSGQNYYPSPWSPIPIGPAVKRFLQAPATRVAGGLAIMGVAWYWFVAGAALGA